MPGAPFATVLVPTHNHSHLIGHALKSIQNQTVADFELFVVGDGAPPATREIVEQLARGDPRVRYFDFAKGERHGEANRHVALQEARGSIVAYCGDDDLWLPQHLATLKKLLGRVDFGNVMQIELYGSGLFVARSGSLSDPVVRRNLVCEARGFYGLTVFGHRMSAYRRLPIGWSPAPQGIATDTHMFQKFAAAGDLTGGTVIAATAIHIVTPHRGDWIHAEREAELAGLAARIGTPDLTAELDAAVEVVRRKMARRYGGHSRLLRRLRRFVARWRGTPG